VIVVIYISGLLEYLMICTKGKYIVLKMVTFVCIEHGVYIFWIIYFVKEIKLVIMF